MHDLKPLPSLLPVTLENGFRLVHLSDLCRNIACQKEIKPKDWHGFTSQPLQSVVVEIHANCPHCGLTQERCVRFIGTADQKARVELFDPFWEGEWADHGEVESL